MNVLARQLAERIPPHVMSRILEDSLNRKEIVKLCNTCGITYKGIRTKSVPTEDLIDDLTEAFYEEEETAQRVVDILTRANERWIQQVRACPPEEVEDLLSEASESEVGRVLFALAVDGRPELMELLSSWEEEWEDSSAVAEVLAHIAAFIGEKEELEKKAESLEQEVKNLKDENEKLREQLEVLQKERKALKEQLAQKERELTSLRRTNRDLEAERDLLQKRLKEEAMSQDIHALTSQMHQLIRENRKLCHDVEKLLLRNETRRPEPFLEALGETVGSIKDMLASLSDSQSRREEELWKGLEDLRREVRAVGAEMRHSRPKKLHVKPTSSPPRVGVFVDVQNMFYSARQLGGRLDFEKLLEVTVAGRRLVRAIAYVVTTPEVDQSKFVTMLRQKGYEVKIKELRKRIDGSAKGDWDMGMAIDIVRLSESLDVVVLVSGDGDFVDLVNLIKTKGPRVEVFSFDQNTSRDLIEAADAYYPIGENMLRPIGV